MSDAKVVDEKDFRYDVMPKFFHHVTAGCDVYFYCLKCGAWHKKNLKEKGDVTELYCMPSLPTDCPKCGQFGESYLRKPVKRFWEDNITPISAKIYTMEDGSKTVSITSRIDFLFLNKQKKCPIIKTSYIRSKIIYSKNGHTYVKKPIDVKTGKMLNLWSREMVDITYGSEQSLQHIKSVIPLVEPLIKKGFIDEEESLKRRFKNLRIETAREFKFWKTTAPIKKNLVDRIIRSVEPTDDEMTLIEKIRNIIKVPSSKKFNKYMIQNPVGTAMQYAVFKYLGFKDINSFWSIVEIAKKDPYILLHRQADTIDFIKAHKNVGTESDIVKAMKKETRIFTDTVDMWARIKSVTEHAFSLTDTFKNIKSRNQLLRPSIKKTHDILAEAILETEKANERWMAETEINNCIKQLLKAETHDEKQFYKNNLISAYIRRDEQAICYTDGEEKFEKNINGIEFFLPKTTRDLADAGKKLHNCVGSCYKTPTFLRDCTIVLMKNQEGFLCGCIEIRNNVIRQAFGPCNKDFDNATNEIFEKWVHSCGLKLGEHNVIAAPLQIDADAYKEKRMEIWKSILKEYPVLNTAKTAMMQADTFEDAPQRQAYFELEPEWPF